jgi:hypothetical protein
MPMALQIIRANEFVRLDINEHLDMEASKRALQGLAQACRKRGLDRAMVDLRGLPIPSKPLFTPQQLAELVEIFHEAGFTKKQRLAVVYEWDTYGGVRNFTSFSRLRGLQVQAFQEFDRAMDWMSEGQEPAAAKPGATVFIKKGKTRKNTGHTVKLTRTDVLPLIPRPTRRERAE